MTYSKWYRLLDEGIQAEEYHDDRILSSLQKQRHHTEQLLVFRHFYAFKNNYLFVRNVGLLINEIILVSVTGNNNKL